MRYIHIMQFNNLSNALSALTALQTCIKVQTNASQIDGTVGLDSIRNVLPTVRGLVALGEEIPAVSAGLAQLTNLVGDLGDVEYRDQRLVLLGRALEVLNALVSIVQTIVVRDTEAQIKGMALTELLRRAARDSLGR